MACPQKRSHKSLRTLTRPRFLLVFKVATYRRVNLVPRILQTCRFFFDPQTLWEGMVCDPKISRDGRVLEEGPFDYQNYFIDTWTKSGHSIPVLEKVASEKLEEYTRMPTESIQTNFIAQLASALRAKKVLEVGKVWQ